MSAISAIEPQRRRGRYNIFVDGEFVVSVAEAVVARLNLRVGLAIASTDLASIARAEERQNALEAAVRALETRPRAVREIRDKLAARGAEADIIDDIVATLTKLGYLDDERFARAWVESRTRSRPGGPRKRRSELIAKGVDRDLIDAAVAPIGEENEVEMARQVAAKIVRRLSDEPNERRRQVARVTGALQRRGFGWPAVKETIRLMGVEIENDEGAGDDG